LDYKNEYISRPNQQKEYQNIRYREEGYLEIRISGNQD